MRKFTASLAILLLVLTSSCDGGAGNRRLVISGSSTLAPLLGTILESYTGNDEDGRISVDVIGSGAGIQRLINGECHLASASRSITSEEVESARERGIEPVGIVVAMDAIALCTGGGISGDVEFSELPALLTADTWNSVRSVWPNEELAKYYPGIDSGTSDFIVGRVLGGDSGRILASKHLQLSEDDHVLVHGVEGDRWALGFFGYSYYIDEKDSMTLLSIDGRYPADGPDYPLSRPLYLYFNQNQSNPAVLRFLEYVVSFVAEGRLPEGFLYPGDALLNENRTRLDEW